MQRDTPKNQDDTSQHITDAVHSSVSDISKSAAYTENELSALFETDTTDTTQKITPEQAFNEALVKLLVLLYQIDSKVTLREQDLFDDVILSLDWRSGISLSAFVNTAIHEARVAIDQKQSREFLFKLAGGLSFNPAQALEYAMDMTEVDGKRTEEELELLALLSNRVLARGLGG